MAYKFQFGAATLSGSLTQEGAVVGESTISGALGLSGFSLDIEQNADVDGTLDVAGQVDLAASGVSTTVRGTFNVDEAATFDSTMSGSSTLDVGGAGTFAGAVKPDADDAYDLGASGTEWKDLYLDGVAYIDELQADTLGAALDANDQAITNINVDSGAIDGTVIGANSQAAAEFTTMSGSSTLSVGGASTFAGVVQPLADDAYDLGASGKEWKDLYIDGVAYIDSLQADQLGAALDANSQAITNINVDSGAIDGTVIGANSQAAAEFTTMSGSSTLSVGGASTFAGVVQPDADDAYDLGASGAEWKDLYLDGVAYIDELQADTLGAALDANDQAITNINVDSGAIDGTVIGGSSQAAGSFTTMSGSSTLQVGGTVRLDGVADTALDVSQDSFFYLDGDDLLMKKDSMADYATAIAGDGLSATAGVLAVDMSELTEEAVNVAADSLIFIDADGNVTRRDTFADYATALAGDAISATAGVLAVEVNSTSFLIAGDEIRLNGTVAAINGGLNVASNALKITGSNIADGTMAVADDELMFIDADGSVKRETWADIASAIAGAGLTATNGVLSADSAGTPTAVGDADATLTEGVSFGNADLTAARTWTLPGGASMEVGDVVEVKAGSNLSTSLYIDIAGHADNTVDGETSIRLESPFAAVKLVYVVSGSWRVF